MFPEESEGKHERRGHLARKGAVEAGQARRFRSYGAPRR